MTKPAKPSYPSRAELASRVGHDEAEGASDHAMTTLDRPVVDLDHVLEQAAREERRASASRSSRERPSAKPRSAWPIVAIAIAACALLGTFVGAMAALLR